VLDFTVDNIVTVFSASGFFSLEREWEFRHAELLIDLFLVELEAARVNGQFHDLLGVGEVAHVKGRAKELPREEGAIVQHVGVNEDGLGNVSNSAHLFQ
jgi:hypothetical protein